MPDYSSLKILHMIAATLVVIGILLAAITVARPSSPATLSALGRWNMAVTGPALLAVWALGVILAIQGHWFASGWMSAKLVFVLVLSALHGMLAGGLKRRQRGEPVSAFLRSAPYITIVSVVAILVLVEAKPF
jgi:uncharacterized membrane protein